MGTLDQIRQMKQEGFSEQEISDSLQEQGISPNSITDAFSQARIKDVVEGENEMQENDFTPGELPLGPEAPSPFATAGNRILFSSRRIHWRSGRIWNRHNNRNCRTSF